MSFQDALQSPGGNAALQTISLLFNAAQLAQRALRQPFRNKIAGQGVSNLAVVTFDATLNEVHDQSSEVTQHPIETGADISDHVRPKPAQVRLDGIITETPLDGSLETAALSAAPGLGLVVGAGRTVAALLQTSSVIRDAFEKLQAMRLSGQFVVVYTPYRSYANMVLQELHVTRDATSGDSLHFSLLFVEVFTVASTTTTINLPAVAQGAHNLGTQATGGASKNIVSADSALAQAANKATGGGFNAAFDARKAGLVKGGSGAGGGVTF